MRIETAILLDWLWFHEIIHEIVTRGTTHEPLNLFKIRGWETIRNPQLIGAFLAIAGSAADRRRMN